MNISRTGRSRRRTGSASAVVSATATLTLAALVVSALPAAAVTPSAAVADNSTIRGASHSRVDASPRPGARAVELSPGQRAKLLKAAAESGAATARSLRLGGGEKLLPKDVVKDVDGTVHTRYARTLGGLPVLGGDLVVHEKAAAKADGKADGSAADKTADNAAEGDPTAATLTVTTADATTPVPAPPPAPASASVAPGPDPASPTVALPAPARTTPALPASAAAKSALAVAKEAGTSKAVADGAPRQVVWVKDGASALAWESVVNGVRDDGGPSRLHVVTDAVSGKKLQEFDRIPAGIGHGKFSGEVELGTVQNSTSGLYELTDSGRGSHKTYSLNNTTTGTPVLVTSPDDIWGDSTVAHPQTAAADAAYGAQQTWDFYHDKFGRNGIANDGVGASSRVHYGNRIVNAYWDGDCFCMLYGDGVNNVNPLTELDVAAHEMTHGVTESTADLYYYNGESGGLNEGSSDIMAAAVEFTDNPNDVPDYLVGELIDIFGDGTPLRYMDRPSKDGISQDYWSARTEGLDPHYSSGVANHFFYLLAEGSGQKTINGIDYDSPTYDNLPVPGVGLENAFTIWYRALTLYMTSTTDFAGARAATLQAAADLYGRSSEAYETVGDTWAAVNVGGRFVNHIALTSPGAQKAAVGQPATVRIDAATSRPGGLTYAAAGLPDGLTLDGATGVVSGSATEAGDFTVTVNASTEDGSSASVDFAWTVIPSGGDFFVNPARVNIPDAGLAVESPLVVTGREGNAPSALKVTVDIIHTYRGDLVIDLIGPEGTAFRLKTNGSDSAPNVHETYTVDASALPANGIWKLRVRDAYAYDTGYLDSWKLTF
ncbi:M4 family metallopeptidase [Streptomyces sp. NPDC093109]|uniref:M4 family metallopeptidase n=1 Tax=Streptomyces sp. NPDC093109 TaxID=3154977 RepID=UPI00344F8491